jgi:hypothetical protein
MLEAQAVQGLTDSEQWRVSAEPFSDPAYLKALEL